MRDIHVGTIRVRVEKLTPEQGQLLGERIAALLTEQFAGGAGQRDIGYLQVRLTLQGGETVDQLASQVVNAVVGAM